LCGVALKLSGQVLKFRKDCDIIVIVAFIANCRKFMEVIQMGMFDKLIANLKASKKTIVFTEGSDARILSAADRLLKEDLMGVVLCGNVEEVKAAAAKGGFDISAAEIIDPETYPEMDALVAQMVELRKGKMTEDEVKAALKKSNYFGTMLVKAGKADALLGGATYSTADTVRPALQIIKTKKGSNLVSSSFILFREKDGAEEKIAMGDCAINLSYSDRLDKDGNVVLSAARQLAEVAVETARTADFFGIDPKVAVLSFSTYGSGKGGTVQLSHDAVIEARQLDPDLVIDGEFQFDAAVSEEVAKTKCPDSKVAGKANTFIFPLIEAGNIGYKIAQRLGGFEAYGPILQGLNAPINDLSRGCTADEVYKMAIITAGMA
jgi:phosphate acetyltransferase